MSLEVSTTGPNVKRALVVDISTTTSAPRSSTSFCTSATALRGTITPGMPAAPAGAGSSTRARRWPSVATARSIMCPSTSIVCMKMPLR